MDLSNFKTSDWLMIGGGVAMLILGFALDWTSVDTGFGSASGDGPFDYFFTGGIAWLLVVAVGALAAANALGKLPSNQPWPLILLAAAALATLLMLLRIILGARFDLADRGIGMFGAFIWSAVALAGAYMSFQSSGGNVKDLTDVDKLGEPVPIELQAGEISLHADMLAHGSRPNESDRRRCGLTIRYCPPTVRVLAPAWADNAILCRGEAPADTDWRFNPRPEVEDLSAFGKQPSIGGN